MSCYEDSESVGLGVVVMSIVGWAGFPGRKMPFTPREMAVRAY